MARITIIGLGLIGASLAMAIKAGRHKVELIGADESHSVMRHAKKQKIVDDTEGSLARAVEGAGLVIVATPPATMREVFEIIAPALGKGAAVTDVASTKQQIMQWAAETLPDYVSFVGGHPMAGKSDQGIENAEATLFQGCPYAVVPAPGASDDAVRSVLGLIETVGARERFMAADEHDQYVAAVSHLPLTLSTALFTLLRRSESWADFAKIAGPAYHDLTRLASGDPQMAADICTTNKDYIQYWIDRYIAELQRYRALLDGDEEAIFREFASAQIYRTKFLAKEDLDDAPHSGVELPDARDQMASLLVSPRIYERVREMTKRAEQSEKKRPH